MGISTKKIKIVPFTIFIYLISLAPFIYAQTKVQKTFHIEGTVRDYITGKLLKKNAGLMVTYPIGRNPGTTNFYYGSADSITGQVSFDADVNVITGIKDLDNQVPVDGRFGVSQGSDYIAIKVPNGGIADVDFYNVLGQHLSDEEIRVGAGETRIYPGSLGGPGLKVARIDFHGYNGSDVLMTEKMIQVHSNEGISHNFKVVNSSVPVADYSDASGGVVINKDPDYEASGSNEKSLEKITDITYPDSFYTYINVNGYDDVDGYYPGAGVFAKVSEDTIHLDDRLLKRWLTANDLSVSGSAYDSSSGQKLTGAEIDMVYGDITDTLMTNYLQFTQPIAVASGLLSGGYGIMGTVYDSVGTDNSGNYSASLPDYYVPYDTLIYMYKNVKFVARKAGFKDKEVTLQLNPNRDPNAINALKADFYLKPN